jgi:hypothetical protein
MKIFRTILKNRGQAEPDQATPPPLRGGGRTGVPREREPLLCP